MKYILTLFAAFFATILLCISCTSTLDNPEQGTAACRAHRRVMTFTVDPAFSDAERAQLSKATGELSDWSNERIGIILEQEGIGVGAVVHVTRVESWMQVVKDRDAREGDRFDVQDYKILGWYADDVVYLVLDRLASPDLLHLLAAHEFTHAVNVRWWNCEENPNAPYLPARGEYDCLHVSDTQSLMSPVFSGQPFSEADRALFRSSCLAD